MNIYRSYLNDMVIIIIQNRRLLTKWKKALDCVVLIKIYATGKIKRTAKLDFLI